MALSETERQVKERSSALYTGQLTDENGDNVPLAAIGTLTLTLYDKATGAIINGRNKQDALNANDVTISATGGVTWKLKSADNPIVNTAIRDGQYEQHVALFEWTYDLSGSGEGVGKHEVRIDVEQLDKVP